MNWKWLKKHTVFMLYGSFIVTAGLCAVIIMAPPPANVSLSGTLTLGGGAGADLSGVSAGQPCSGKRSVADIAGGAKVVVYSGDSNTALKTALLGDGKIDPYGNCVFKFALTDFNKVANYSIAVAERPRYAYSLTDFKTADFKVDLKLGELNTKDTGVGVSQSADGAASKSYRLQDVSGSQNTAN